MRTFIEGIVVLPALLDVITAGRAHCLVAALCVVSVYPTVPLFCFPVVPRTSTCSPEQGACSEPSWNLGLHIWSCCIIFRFSSYISDTRDSFVEWAAFNDMFGGPSRSYFFASTSVDYRRRTETFWPYPYPNATPMKQYPSKHITCGKIHLLFKKSMFSGFDSSLGPIKIWNLSLLC